MLKLVRLEKKYIPQLNDMMDEWMATGERVIPWAIRKRDYHDFEAYRDSLEITESDGRHVPDSTFFCLDTDRNIFVGAVNIRHTLNEGLLKDGGHIGDGIRPSERGNVLMCCDKDNAASARTIVKNGGVLENEIEVNSVPVQRYWIHR